MMDKMKSWLFGDIILPRLLARGVRHATTYLASFLASAYFATKIEPILQQYGISISKAELVGSIGTILGSLSGAILHYVQYQVLKKGTPKEG